MSAWALPYSGYKPLRQMGARTPQRVVVAMRNGAERQRLTDELQRAGYRVIAHDNCYDALLACRQSGALHGLVTEVELPHMWGLELAVCASRYHRNVAVVCVCGAEPKLGVKREIEQRGWQWMPKGPAFHLAVVQRLQTGLTTLMAS